jgi:hypothetical protein
MPATRSMDAIAPGDATKKLKVILPTHHDALVAKKIESITAMSMQLRRMVNGEAVEGGLPLAEQASSTCVVVMEDVPAIVEFAGTPTRIVGWRTVTNGAHGELALLAECSGEP